MNAPHHHSTCDLCDAQRERIGSAEGEDFRVLPPVLPSFGGRQRFHGLVSTIQCFEDNSGIKAAVESLFKVKVKAVNTIVRKGKVKAFKFRKAQLSDTKRAIVTLAPDDHIDIFGNAPVE